MLAVDGFELDVPDTPENAREFGYAGSGDNRSAFPKACVVGITECGTHMFLAAQVGGYSAGEKTLAAKLYQRLVPGQLLTADRWFYSWKAWSAASRWGADLVWRAPTGLRLPVVKPLQDGSYLTLLIRPGVEGVARERIIETFTISQALDPDQGDSASQHQTP